MIVEATQAIEINLHVYQLVQSLVPNVNVDGDGLLEAQISLNGHILLELENDGIEQAALCLIHFEHRDGQLVVALEVLRRCSAIGPIQLLRDHESHVGSRSLC